MKCVSTHLHKTLTALVSRVAQFDCFELLRVQSDHGLYSDRALSRGIEGSHGMQRMFATCSTH